MIVSPEIPTEATEGAMVLPAHLRRRTCHGQNLSYSRIFAMQPWKSIKPDLIDIVSPEGEVRSRVNGYYGGSTFFIDDMNVDVRPGDEIRRRLPNGREEAFFVEDPKFYDSHFGKHYQVKISRRGTFDPKTGGLSRYRLRS